MMRTFLHIILCSFLSIAILEGQINVDDLYSRYENVKLNNDASIDSLLILNQIGRNTNHVLVYNASAKDLLSIYQQRANLGLSYRLLIELVEVNSEWQHHEGIYFAARKLAEYYYEAQLYAKARSYLQMIDEMVAPSLYNRIENLEWIAQLYGNEGKPDSAEVYIKILESAYPSNDPNSRISRIQTLADIYLGNSKFERAKDLYLQIEAIVIENKFDSELFAIANNLGYISSLKEDQNSAIEYFKKAESAMAAASMEDQIKVLINLAIQYNKVRNAAESEAYLVKANKLAIKHGESNALIHHLLSELQLAEGQIYRAEYFNQLAISDAIKIEDEVLLSDAYYVAAIVHTELLDYESALQFYDKHLNIRNRLENELKQTVSDAANIKEQLSSKENELKFLKLEKIRRENERKRLVLSEKNLQLANDTLLLSQRQSESALLLSKKEVEVQNEKLKVQQLEALKTRNENSLLKQSLEFERQKSALDSIEVVKKFELDSLTREQERVEQEALRLQQDNAINQLELAKQEDFKKFISIIAILSGLIFLLTLGGLLNLRGRNKIIKKERERSDLLLHSILPQETAEELKLNGFASPRNYDKVTVMFTDFTDFTRISGLMSAEELIKELETCYSVFDEIVEKYDLERIKIIGDSYMCAGGVPIKDEDNPDRVVNAAIEMQKYINKRFAEKKEQKKDYWQMRVGIHTGPVVAGVVGKNKFAYDIWGDTVNIASRLENQSSAGKIIVSTVVKDMLTHSRQFDKPITYALKGGKQIEAQFVEF